MTRYIFYLYAFIMPYGSVNTFNLSALYGVSNANVDQQGIGSYFFALCVFMAAIDRKIWPNYRTIIKFFQPLSTLFVALFISTILYEGYEVPFPYSFFVKLFVAEVGFCILAIYFIRYPKVMLYSLTIYAYSCVIIVIAYFGGFLDGLYFVSKGRLWLFGENPNSFSFMMGLGAIILLYNNKRYKSKMFQILNVIVVCAIFYYMVLSGSRGSFLMCALAVVILYYKYLLKKIVFVIPVLLILISIGITSIEKRQNEVSFVERFEELQEGDDDRTELLWNTWTLYTERPVLGWGRSGYVVERSLRFHEDRDSHNMFMSIIVMSGVIGLLAILLFLYHIGFGCITVSRRNVFPIIVFFYVFFMSMKTGDVITFAMMWYCYAIVYAMAIVEIRKNKEIVNTKASFSTVEEINQ